LAALASPDLHPDAMVGPGAPFDDGRKMQRWLLAAALTRIVLVEFLIAHESRGAVETLHEYVDNFGRISRERGARRFADWMTFVRALRALVLAPQDAPPDFEPLSALYGEWHPTGLTMAYQPPGSVEEAWRGCDPIAVRLGLSTPSAGERWLVRHALTYLES